MKLLIVTRDAQRGTPVKKAVSSDFVRVGRHASSEIYLPDPRVTLAQGMLVWRDGLVYIEGESGIATATKSTTRKAVRSLRLHYGEPIEIGPYRLESIAPPPGFDGAVSVEFVQELKVAPGLASRTSRLTLASLGLTKRWAAWGLAIAALLVLFVLPASRVFHLPLSGVANTAGVSDRMWNPGEVMLAHQPIEKKCDACHEIAFHRVRDAACLECHSKIGQHVAADLHPVALFEGARCATCHREHKGLKATHRDDDAFCVSCHRDLRAKVRDTEVKNATDFAKDHPAFRAVRAEASGLVFPHDKHLDPKGVKSPAKGTVKLECASCHKPDASRRSFEPVSMAKRCQECHSLQFEPAVTKREVPHGKPEEAVAVIEDFYANLALQGTRDSFQKAFGVPGEGLLRRVGSPSTPQRESALALAKGKARLVATDLFEKRACKQCHDVKGFEIAPVKISPLRMPHARFDHKAHASSKCVDCHDVARAKRISEVALPKIDKCRECHAGAKPVEAKLTSNCLLCHGFHDESHPWDPAFVPRAKNAR
jgi:predicted CXXCH cytochrome family protein